MQKPERRNGVREVTRPAWPSAGEVWPLRAVHKEQLCPPSSGSLGVKFTRGPAIRKDRKELSRAWRHSP